MKSRILVLAMLLGAVGFANATAVCTGLAAPAVPVAVTVPAAPLFIKEGFNMNCSKNTFVNYDENEFAVGVCAASVKGKNKFGGSSEGGSVGNKGQCTGGAGGPGDGCNAADATPVIATGC